MYVLTEPIISVRESHQAVLLATNTGKRPMQRLVSRNIHFLRAVLLVQHDAHGRLVKRHRVMIFNIHMIFDEMSHKNNAVFFEFKFGILPFTILFGRGVII